MHNKIVDNVYSVGVLNPNMRVFDVVLNTEYGTSYNSFLVKGTDKTALIETSHSRFDAVFLENIKEVCNPSEIDYIILNHNEPDHSGALADLCEYLSNAQVVSTVAGAMYIKDITNKDLEVRVVKDGDKIDLGGKTLEFFNVPLVHWPDTMFTWLKEDKILFSCDFLGAHYCEPLVFDTKVTYIDAYKQAFKEYFDAIMVPFKPSVRKGLGIIKDFDIEYICVSHGPVLTKKGFLSYAVNQYKEWSREVEKTEKDIAIVFGSAYGNTEKLAKKIGDTIASEFKKNNVVSKISFYDVNEFSIAEIRERINESDGFLIGSPTINRGAVPYVFEILAGVDIINARNKPVGAFGSFGWSGEAVFQLNSFMQSLTLKPIGDGFRVKLVPNLEELEEAGNFAAKYVKEGFNL